MLSIVDTRPFPPVPSVFNLAQHVLRRGLSHPEKTALEVLYPDRTEAWTYSRLTAAILGCGGWLLARGLAPGDRVLIRLSNTAAFPILYLGAIAAGLVPVATAAALTATEITRMAALVRPRMIVATPGIALPASPAPVVAADLAAWQGYPRCPFHQGDPNREAYVIFTSGTSGSPLAVRHAHRAVLARAAMHDGWEGLTEADRLLHAGAFNWTYTMGTGLIDPWTLGATALIPATGTDPAALPNLLHRAEATIFAAAPGLYRQLLRATIPPLPHLRHGLSAGETMPASVRTAWTAATGTEVYEALGMTELSTYISSSPARPCSDGATGFVQNGRHVALLDHGTPVPRGTPGTLAIHRDDPGLTLGYGGVLPENGDWFLTGDIAVMADNGAVTWLCRADDMMNPGGFRVAPQEVEYAMQQLQGLATCAAIEVEVAPGTRIIACYYESDQPIDATTLHDHASVHLARWKQPRSYHHLDKLPRTANGKLDRRTLAALARKEGA
ncbi:class I adenylate-forming enzyme family protein [Tabrizicola sp.]|uniref:class I adenylate-forming enzyme family protein n=1 Tax=Tabrizicola sp. TaxID=2005166 RepID=UPI00286B966E|nr:class I adenylate-forming enzyme family protein [Tabrizicola sp.]